MTTASAWSTCARLVVRHYRMMQVANGRPERKSSVGGGRAQKRPKTSKNVPVKFHAKHLAEFLQMPHNKEIRTMAMPYGSGGGSAKGPMQGIVLQNHIASSVAGGASAKGPMQGIVLQNHIASSVAGGGSAQGPMQGIDLQNHICRIKDRQAQGQDHKHYRMMQVANGRPDQENLWKCVIHNVSGRHEYRFHSGNDVEIVGVRKFEAYLLDALNGYGEKNLTADGKAARKMMEQQRHASDNLKLKRERKSARQDE
jgi:hypothetical protein